MKRASPYVCDGCGAEKNATNHWWLAMEKYARDTLGLLVIPWEDSFADDPGVQHLCGTECATKALSKWMGAGR